MVSIMNIKLGSAVSILVSSLFCTGIWTTAYGKSISVGNIPDGAYSFSLGYSSDLSPDYYFDFRKRGNRVVGIKYTSGGPVDDPEPGQKICIEGTISGKKIIGSGVAVVVKSKSAKVSSKSPNFIWPERYAIRMTRESVRKVRKYRDLFIITSTYNKATMNFDSFTLNEKGHGVTKISTKKIPTTCNSFN
jgi:hypothetical protein